MEISIANSSADFVMSTKPQQWRVCELTFTAENDYDKPWEILFSAVFTAPNNVRYDVPGFWDGGKTWKIRFTPTASGEWFFASHCAVKDNGLDGKNGKFTVHHPDDCDNPLHRHGGILKVSESKHYLTYTDGTPFFWLGDTWWFCPSDLVPFKGSSNPQINSAYKTLIDTRKSQGYTIVQIAFLEGIQGIKPTNFLRKKPADVISYWQEVDRYINYANDAGIIPVIGLAFSSEMDELSLEKWKIIWRYVIARYGAHAVTWLICGEYNQAHVGNVNERVPKTLALGQFIKDTDPYKRAMSVHPWWYKGEERQAWNEPWYDFIMLQGAHEPAPPSVEIYLDTYNNKPTRPVLECETKYEGIRGFTDIDVRWSAYRAIQAGSFGFTYGSHGLWYPTQNENDSKHDVWGEPMVWWKALKRSGGTQMEHLKKCYESVEWWKLEPRPDAIKTTGKLEESERILTKADGENLFVIYFPRNTQNVKATLTGYQQQTEVAVYSVLLFNPRTGSVKELNQIQMIDGELLLPQRPSDEDWLIILRKIAA